jgi:hypothetical protein
MVSVAMLEVGCETVLGESDSLPRLAWLADHQVMIPLERVTTGGTVIIWYTIESIDLVL